MILCGASHGKAIPSVDHARRKGHYEDSNFETITESISFLTLFLTLSSDQCYLFEQVEIIFNTELLVHV
jgi:hypothetical protein